MGRWFPCQGGPYVEVSLAMGTVVLAMFVRLTAASWEANCRADPDMYYEDPGVGHVVSECDGMAAHLMSVGHIEWIDQLPPVFSIVNEPSDPCSQY